MFSIFSYKITEKQLIIAILLLGALLRFWGLGSAEFYHDEGFKAFRSIGYLDYIQNDDQTTPIQWFKDASSLPWWTSLSFHDHPPLFFLIQNISFKIFGDSLLAARLPSAIAGLGSIYLVYLLSQRFFSNKAARLFAPLLLSFNLIHIWISRSSLMESVQVFFILLNIYYFFRIAHNSILSLSKDYLLFGVTLGLAFLTKYTSAFLVPVYFTYLILFGGRTSSILKNWRLYAALGLALLLFTPVLIYNFYLYKTVGHFDLQFSYLFRQPTPEWRVSLGKIQDPFSEIISNLTLMYSMPFLFISLAGIGYAIYSRANRIAVFWLLNFIFITLMLAKVGSGFRFIVLYAAPSVMLITYLFDYLYSKFPKEVFFRILLAAFLAYELFFGTDIFRTFPDFGIVKLDQYFDSEFGNFRSLAVPNSPNPHLDKIIKKNAIRFPERGKLWLIVYDDNIGLSPRLWLFTRRNYYHSIPVLNVSQFKNLMKIGGVNKFDGYEIYFVKASPYTVLNQLFFGPAAQELETYLVKELNLSPVKLIYSRTNYLMFTVYKFIL